MNTFIRGVGPGFGMYGMLVGLISDLTTGFNCGAYFLKLITELTCNKIFMIFELFVEQFRSSNER